MQTSPLRPVLSVALALWFGVMACGSSSSMEPTATPLPRPTQKPQATSTTKPEPTDKPAKPTKTPKASTGGGEGVVLADEPLEHESGGFSIYLPAGWEIDEKANSVYAEAPDQTMAIDVNFVHTGVELSAAEYDAFIDAVEANWFATNPNYELLQDKAPQEDGSIGVFKTLDWGDTPQTVLSYYWQQGEIVYEIDLWVDSALYADNEAGLLAVANSMEINPEALADIEPYRLGYYFNGADLFEFQVPYSWAHTTKRDGDTTVDKFDSPDEAATIESVMNLSGDFADLDEARAATLVLLADAYAVTEADLIGEEEQEDGSIRLDWKTDDAEGNTFYEVRDGNFLFLNFAAKAELFDTYYPVWSLLLDTYGLPEED